MVLISHTTKDKPRGKAATSHEEQWEMLPVFVKWHWTLEEDSGSSAGSSSHLPGCIPPRLPTETITVTCHSPVSFCPHCQTSNLHSVPPEGSPWRPCSWGICTVSLLTSKHLLTAWHQGSSEPVIVWIHLIPSLSSISSSCLVKKENFPECTRGEQTQSTILSISTTLYLPSFFIFLSSSITLSLLFYFPISYLKFFWNYIESKRYVLKN